MLPDEVADLVGQGHKLQRMHHGLADDDIYKKRQTYNFLFSCSIGNQVHLVSLEADVLWHWGSTAQQKMVHEDKILLDQVTMELLHI